MSIKSFKARVAQLHQGTASAVANPTAEADYLIDLLAEYHLKSGQKHIQPSELRELRQLIAIERRKEIHHESY